MMATYDENGTLLYDGKPEPMPGGMFAAPSPGIGLTPPPPPNMPPPSGTVTMPSGGGAGLGLSAMNPTAGVNAQMTQFQQGADIFTRGGTVLSGGADPALARHAAQLHERQTANHERAVQMQEFGVKLQAIDFAVKHVQSLTGEAKTAAEDQIGQILDKQFPDGSMSGAVRTLAKRPDFSAQLFSQYGNIPMMQASLAIDPTGASFFKEMQDPAKFKMAQTQMDENVGKAAKLKILYLANHFDKLAPPDVVEKAKAKGGPDATDIMMLSQHLGDPAHPVPGLSKLALTSTDLAAAGRNPSWWHQANISDPEAAQKTAEALRKIKAEKTFENQLPPTENQRLTREQAAKNADDEARHRRVTESQGAAHLSIAQQNATTAARAADPFGLADSLAAKGSSATGGGIDVKGLTGDELLKALPAPLAEQVKALAEGRRAFPAGAGQRSPAVQQLLMLVGQYDPSFDAVDFNKRNRTATNFSAGRQGDAVRAVNQTIKHMGSLDATIDKLDNSDIAGANLVTPAVNLAKRKILNDPTQGQFRQNVQAVASELRKVYAGSGGGTLTELKSWEDSLPMNESKGQQKAYLAKGVELLGGAIEALNNQYRSGMGPKANILDNDSLVTPEARRVLSKLSGAVPDTASTWTPDKESRYQELLKKQNAFK